MLRVYLTDLAAYNNGYFVGEWIELPINVDVLERHIIDVLNKGGSISGDGKHEEYFITDYEWEEKTMFEIDEYDNIYRLNEQVGLLDEFEDIELKKIKVLIENGLVDNIEEAIENLENVIVYENTTMTDIAEKYVEEIVDLAALPPLISSHIDYKAIGRDIEIEGSFFRDSNDIFEYIV